MRRFDQKRPGRRTSNQEWKNPHDPQAKVRRTKDGACAMIYKFDMGTVIGDVHAARRRKQGLAAPLRRALRRAACAVNGQSGKTLLRKRGMHLERSFEHVLDEGGLRRATLRGTENLTKRHKIAATCFNLSLLLRTLLGVGTPKQWMAGAYDSFKAFIAYLDRGALWFRRLPVRTRALILVFPNFFGTPVAA